MTQELTKKTRSGTSETARRVSCCVRMLVRGKSAYSISQLITSVEERAENGEEEALAELKALNKEFDLRLPWGVSARAIQRYCRKAFVEIDEQLNAANRSLFFISLARYNAVYERAWKEGDLRACILAQRQIDQITGVNRFGGSGAGEDAKETATMILPDGSKITIS